MFHLKKVVCFLAAVCVLQSLPFFCAYSLTPSELSSWVDEQKQCLQARIGTNYTIEIFNFSNKEHLYAHEKLSGTLSSPVPFDDRINNFIARSKLFQQIKVHTSSPFTSWLVASKDNEDNKVILNIWEMDFNGYTRVKILGNHLYSSIDMFPAFSACVFEFLHKRILGKDTPVLEHPDIRDLISKFSSDPNFSPSDLGEEIFYVSFKNFYVSTMKSNWEELKKFYHVLGFHNETQKISPTHIFYTPSSTLIKDTKSSG